MHDEPSTSTAGKLAGWYIFKIHHCPMCERARHSRMVWVENLTAIEAVAELFPQYHFSDVSITPVQGVGVC
jgi:hypothetical protein